MLYSNRKFKKGATSIYVVIMGTLLFSVIAVSFIRIVINETAKTTSDELAQAAYDAALAGVEDAKTALKRYYECLSITENESRPVDCEQYIMRSIENGFKYSDLVDPSDPNYGNCDTIAEALQRKTITGEVLVQEQNASSNSGNIVQAYTCVTIDNSLSDYRSTLGNSIPIRVIPLKTVKPEDVTGIRISWYTEDNGLFDSLNYLNKSHFRAGSDTSTPPTLSAQIIQTADQFRLGQFSTYDKKTNTTNRGTVVLTPTDDSSGITHVGRVAGNNDLTVLADSNNHSYDRTTTNQPQRIRCYKKGVFEPSEEYACRATIEIPAPIDGLDSSGNISERNMNTFFLVLTLPYANTNTDFSVELCTDTDSPRGDCKMGSEDAIAEFKDAQISVDSTGRANDMYARVEARLEFKDNFPFAEFAVQATGSDDDSISKDFYVTSGCITVDDNNQIISCNNTN